MTGVVPVLLLLKRMNHNVFKNEICFCNIEEQNCVNFLHKLEINVARLKQSDTLLIAPFDLL